MFSKSVYFFIFLSVILLGLVIEVIYLDQNRSLTKKDIQQKRSFVHTTGLPDLALSTDANYIRHRSLSNVSSILNEDGTLREYFPSTFTYAPPKGINEK